MYLLFDMSNQFERVQLQPLIKKQNETQSKTKNSSNFKYYAIGAFVLSALVAAIVTIALVTKGPSPAVVYTVDHSYNTTGSKFWEQVYQGMSVTLETMNVDLQRQSSHYNADLHIQYIKNGCDNGDALAVTVPWHKMSNEYSIVDAAINECMTRRPDLPVFTFNTDTYENSKVWGYIGSTNRIIGERCAYIAMGNGQHDVISGRSSAGLSTSNLPPHIVLYVSDDERANYGIQSRIGAFVNVLGSSLIGNDDHLLNVTYDVADIPASAAVVAFGSGAAKRVLDNNLAVFLNCGDDVLSDENFYGQATYTQGAMVGGSVGLAAKGKWFAATRGNSAMSSDALAFHMVVLALGEFNYHLYALNKAKEPICYICVWGIPYWTCDESVLNNDLCHPSSECNQYSPFMNNQLCGFAITMPPTPSPPPSSPSHPPSPLPPPDPPPSPLPPPDPPPSPPPPTPPGGFDGYNACINNTSFSGACAYWCCPCQDTNGACTTSPFPSTASNDHCKTTNFVNVCNNAFPATTTKSPCQLACDAM